MSTISKNTAILVLILSLFLLFGCKKDDATGPGGKVQLAAVTNLQAYSASSTSVGVHWTLSTDENVADFDDYKVTAKTQAGVAVATAIALEGENSAVVVGLTEGVIYNFEVVAEVIAGSSDYENSNPVTIKWSPAPRLVDDNFGLPIKVYETSSSSSFGSGLILFDPGLSKPKVVSVASPGGDALLIDAVLYTGTNNSVSLKSASMYNASWKLTRFSSVVRSATSLDDPRATPPDSTTYSATSIQFDSVTVASSQIYYFKGDNGNYGRILVQRDITGRLIWGTSGEQYLNLIISYQTVPYNPYSKTAYTH